MFYCRCPFASIIAFPVGKKSERRNVWPDLAAQNNGESSGPAHFITRRKLACRLSPLHTLLRVASDLAKREKLPARNQERKRQEAAMARVLRGGCFRGPLIPAAAIFRRVAREGVAEALVYPVGCTGMVWNILGPAQQAYT